MSKKSSYKVAMAGATGAVGEALLAILKGASFRSANPPLVV
jgi:aspartate-semialdehyde dehydrogenase